MFKPHESFLYWFFLRRQFWCLIFIIEPPRDKTNKMTMRPAKTQISLGIRPVWSESSLCARRIAKDPSFLHADSEDSGQTGRMPRLIWIFAGRTVILLVLSRGGSYGVVVPSHRAFSRIFSFSLRSFLAGIVITSFGEEEAGRFSGRLFGFPYWEVLRFFGLLLGTGGWMESLNEKIFLFFALFFRK